MREFAFKASRAPIRFFLWLGLFMRATSEPCFALPGKPSRRSATAVMNDPDQDSSQNEDP